MKRHITTLISTCLIALSSGSYVANAQDQTIVHVHSAPYEVMKFDTKPGRCQEISCWGTSSKGQYFAKIKAISSVTMNVDEISDHEFIALDEDLHFTMRVAGLVGTSTELEPVAQQKMYALRQLVSATIPGDEAISQKRGVWVEFDVPLTIKAGETAIKINPFAGYNKPNCDPSVQSCEITLNEMRDVTIMLNDLNDCASDQHANNVNRIHKGLVFQHMKGSMQTH